MFVYNILKNHINCFDIFFEVGFYIQYKITRNLDLFVVPNYNTNKLYIFFQKLWYRRIIFPPNLIFLYYLVMHLNLKR